MPDVWMPHSILSLSLLMLSHTCMQAQAGFQTNDDNFLSPGEDPYSKIRRNLFMKVLVDKKTCFVGEPVTAIFKLYSRLNSKSDIVKNPGFYGFTVQDMINLGNKITDNEIINGKKFDVHIIRKVQLYPWQAGLFHIDAMEVRNKVRFSKSTVNKKAEQEIVEGMFPPDDIATDENTTVFENSMSTEPVAIKVKPTPQNNKPAAYNGAIGNFKLTASLQKNELAKNEEGDLVITISGKGNFMQLPAPGIQWPAGIEELEPTVNDSLNYMQSPMTGKREFHFRFVPVKPGNYDLPAVSFSFFNPDTNQYRTISSRAITMKVSTLEKAIKKVKAKDSKANGHNKSWTLWVAGCLAVATIFFFILKGRQNQKTIKPGPFTENKNNLSTVTAILQPANIFSGADHKTFYNILRNCIWKFFTERFGLMGSKMNKVSLSAVMQQKNIDEENKIAILEILERCETSIFINVEPAGDKNKLLKETKEVLEKISNQLL